MLAIVCYYVSNLCGAPLYPDFYKEKWWQRKTPSKEETISSDRGKKTCRNFILINNYFIFTLHWRDRGGKVYYICTGELNCTIYLILRVVISQPFPPHPQLTKVRARPTMRTVNTGHNITINSVPKPVSPQKMWI